MSEKPTGSVWDKVIVLLGVGWKVFCMPYCDLVSALRKANIHVIWFNEILGLVCGAVVVPSSVQ